MKLINCKNAVSTLAAGVLGMSMLVGCAGSPTERSTGQVVDDTVLLTQVKSALIADDQAKAGQINVEVYKGEVQLNGFVDNAEQKAAAATAAKNVNGVTAVKNNLQIAAADRSSGAVVDDTTIAAKVKAALVDDQRTKAGDILVESNAGVVQLGGFVESEASKAAATSVAQGIEGVKSVKNGIEIRK